MLEGLGLLLACLDFFKVAEKAEAALERWHSNLDIWVDVIADSFKNPVQHDGGDTLVSIPALICFVLAVGGPIIAVFIIEWHEDFSLPIFRVFMLSFGGMACTAIVLTFLAKFLHFVLNTILLILAVFRRAPSGIIGSVGLLIAIVAFLDRML